MHRGYGDLYRIGEHQLFCNAKVAGLGEIFIQRNVYVYSMFLEIKEKDCLAHLYIIGMQKYWGNNGLPYVHIQERNIDLVREKFDSQITKFHTKFPAYTVWMK